MPEKLSNEQRHERFWCGFTHVKVAWVLVALCAWTISLSWRGLDKPIARPSITELPFYILMVVFYAPPFWMVFRCFSERFIVGIVTLHTGMAVTTWFVPTLFNPISGLIGRVFLVLWVIALFMSVNMALHAGRNPYVAPEGNDPPAKKGLLIMGVVVVVLLAVGVLIYWVPRR